MSNVAVEQVKPITKVFGSKAEAEKYSNSTSWEEIRKLISENEVGSHWDGSCPIGSMLCFVDKNEFGKYVDLLFSKEEYLYLLAKAIEGRENMDDNYLPTLILTIPQVINEDGSLMDNPPVIRYDGTSFNTTFHSKLLGHGRDNNNCVHFNKDSSYFEFWYNGSDNVLRSRDCIEI